MLTFPVIFISQIFLFFPISGVFNKDHRNLNFKWISVRTLISVWWLFCAITFLFLELKRLFNSGEVNAKSIMNAVFYLSSLSYGILLFRLAKEWPIFVGYWCQMEKHFLNSRFNSGWSLKNKVLALMVFILTGALFEHSMCIASFLYDRYKQAIICGWHIDSYFGYIVSTLLPHIFNEISYTVPTGIWAIFMNVSLTFVWNFIDLLIMVVSMCLAQRFNQLNERLRLVKGQVSIFPLVFLQYFILQLPRINLIQL